MGILLDAYRHTVSPDRVRKQGNGYNGPCPFCGGSDFRSDRFIVWEDSSERLGKTCIQHNILGSWYCRQCGKSGDTIAFLMEVDGMTFSNACAELGIASNTKRRSFRRAPKLPQISGKNHSLSSWEITAVDKTLWQNYALKLHTEARENLARNATALEWLKNRGLSHEAIEQYQLGYLPGENNKTGRYRNRSSLGLKPVDGKDGNKKTTIFIPRGITIPHFDEEGKILRIRIRRPAPDFKQWGQKYIVLEGSSSQPMLLAPFSSRFLSAYVIVEAELDAMLIHHTTSQKLGVLAVLTNRGKPDIGQHEIIRDAATILVSLDYDPRTVTKPNGDVVVETPGGQGWTWWASTYTNAKRWPVPVGKDPGDAYESGINILNWLEAGLPPSISLLSNSISDEGIVEPCSFALNELGERGKDEGCPLDQNREEAHYNLPPYLTLDEIHESVLLLYHAWESVPSFKVQKYPDVCHYDWDKAWAKLSNDNWEKIGKLQHLLVNNNRCWAWVWNINQNTTVTLDNFFHIYG